MEKNTFKFASLKFKYCYLVDIFSNKKIKINQQIHTIPHRYSSEFGEVPKKNIVVFSPSSPKKKESKSEFCNGTNNKQTERQNGSIQYEYDVELQQR